MYVLGAALTQACHIHMLQNVEYGERGHALGVGGQIACLQAPIAHTQRSNRFCIVLGKVSGGQQPAVVCKPAGHALGQFAFIKRTRPLLGNEAQCGGKLWQAQALAHMRGLARGQKSAGKARLVLQLPIALRVCLAVLVQPVGQRGGNGKAF